jgi:hypothetical protein
MFCEINTPISKVKMPKTFQTQSRLIENHVLWQKVADMIRKHVPVYFTDIERYKISLMV